MEGGEIGKHNLKVRHHGEEEEIAVPILEEQNLGTQMAVDEKTINGVCYTILSNRRTSKIALMAATLKVGDLMKLISQFDMQTRMQVKSLSRDMASNYDWLGRQAFMNAYQVVDKFHVIKSIMEPPQAIRIRYRQQELARRREVDRNKKKEKLKVLLKELIQSGIEERENAAYLIKRNMGQIINYFIAKETNAKAEVLNQNLQRFINVNYGA